MADRQIIVGLHSVEEALKNTDRIHHELVISNKSTSLLNKLERPADLKITTLNDHSFQERAKKEFKNFDFTYKRVSSGIMLISDVLEEKNISWIYDQAEKKEELKILCLDQVTDAHNGAAIMRTAAFYGIDAIVIASKGNFGKSPSFTRIASGALEHVNIVRVPSLSTALKKIKDKGIFCVGLSEHANVEASEIAKEKKICLVVGAEDVGMSNAVKRSVEHVVALVPRGEIKSLNVSVAAAMAMGLFF